jgi:DNA-binding MarR family transcriptional regulator
VLDEKEQIVRRMLIAIDADAGISQRALSMEIGIAVGSVNWYLKRCVKKGLIKLQQVPIKRYLYYLTPQGFDEKAKLTAGFLRSSFALYREGRKECAQFFRDCATGGKRSVYLAGDGEFAEIAVLSSFDLGFKLSAIIDRNSKRGSCASVPIFGSLQAAIEGRPDGLPDAILVTELNNTKSAYRRAVTEAARLGLGSHVIYVPAVLNFKP